MEQLVAEINFVLTDQLPDITTQTGWLLMWEISSVISNHTKYMIMSRDQNAGRSHSMKIDNSPIERVEEFKYLGTTLTNQNSIQEKNPDTIGNQTRDLPVCSVVP